MSDLTTYPAIVGQILVRRRSALGLEQAEVAKRMGLSPSTWSRVENGYSGLSVEQLVKVARILGTKPSVLLAEADKARAGLEADNINVLDKRTEQQMGAGSAIVLGAVLGFLIARILAK